MISTLRRTSSAASSGADRAFPPHIGTRWRCSVLLCSQARAEPAEFPRNGWTHVAGSVADRYPIRGTFFGCCASAEEQSAKSMAQSGRPVIVLLMCFSRVFPSHRSLLACSSCLFDHLIRPRQHVRRNRQTDLLGGFQIDDELELFRLLHRQVSRLGAFQNLVHICGGAAVQVEIVRRRRMSPPASHIFVTWVYRWEPILYRKF